MRVVNDSMVFEEGEKVFAINKGKRYCVGTLKQQRFRGVPSLVVFSEDPELASLKYDCVIPYNEHLHEWLEEQPESDSYKIITETYEGIIANKGRRIIDAK